MRKMNTADWVLLPPPFIPFFPHFLDKSEPIFALGQFLRQSTKMSPFISISPFPMSPSSKFAPIFPLLVHFFSIEAIQRIGFIDFCDPFDPQSCGLHGKCLRLAAGTRCECPQGWMGPGCKRPCQDVHRSCGRWHRQGRCNWHKSILSPFFTDNCPLSCGFCRQSKGAQKKLSMPLPPILEPLSWLIGRWQTQTLGNRTDRFPAPLSDAYIEVLDIQIGDAPAFDRPSLNVSIRAWTPSADEHNELGFLTVKPAKEQTGFVLGPEMEAPNDLVALELASNTGILVIEEGKMKGEGQQELELKTNWHRHFGKKEGAIHLDLTRRTFILVGENILEERLEYRGEGGGRRRVVKRFRKVHDYFEE